MPRIELHPSTGPLPKNPAMDKSGGTRSPGCARLAAARADIESR